MKFCSWLYENRPMELRRSWRRLGSPLSLFSSLSCVNRQEKWALFVIIPLLSQLSLSWMCGPRRATCPPSWLETIYSVSIQVQIISHELNPSHFPIFEIFVNNLVPGSHSTPITPKNVKIRLFRNSTKFVGLLDFARRIQW